MGGKKKYINIFGSFTEPFNWQKAYYWQQLGLLTVG